MIEAARENGLCKTLSSMSNTAPTGDGEKTNFALSVKSRVFDPIEGVYVAGLFLHAHKPNFILASRGTCDGPVIRIVMTRDCVALMWFSSQKVARMFQAALHEGQMDSHGLPPIVAYDTVLTDSVLVLHPIHIVSKWQRAIERSKHKNPHNNFVPLNIMAKYVTNSLLPLEAKVQ